MKKTFDCVEMKNRIQQAMREEDVRMGVMAAADPLRLPQIPALGIWGREGRGGSAGCGVGAEGRVNSKGGGLAY